MLDPNQEIKLEGWFGEADARELLAVAAGRNRKPWWTSRLLLVGAAAVLHGVWMAHEEGLSFDACLWAGFGAAVGFLRVVTTKILTLTKQKDQK